MNERKKKRVIQRKRTREQLFSEAHSIHTHTHTQVKTLYFILTDETTVSYCFDKETNKKKEALARITVILKCLMCPFFIRSASLHHTHTYIQNACWLTCKMQTDKNGDRHTNTHTHTHVADRDKRERQSH